MATREYRAVFRYTLDGKDVHIQARLEADSYPEALALAEESIELSNSGAVLMGVYAHE
jgi:hypothetical protein